MGRARVEEIKNEEVTEKLEETPEVEETPEAVTEKTEKEDKEMEKEKAEYIIEVKNKSYTGTAANVQFKNGVGITKNELLADYFKARGAKITKK